MFRRTLPFLFLSVLIAGVMLACGSSDTNTGTTSPTGPAPTTAPAQHFKVGQAVNVGTDWQITVNTVKTSAGDDIMKPAAGNTFLIVNITVSNVSQQPQTISSLLNFKLRDADGTEGKVGILSTGTTPAPDGKIAAGSKAKGDLVYEVAANQKNFTLSFEADLVSGGQTIWDLKL